MRLFSHPLPGSSEPSRKVKHSGKTSFSTVSYISRSGFPWLLHQLPALSPGASGGHAPLTSHTPGALAGQQRAPGGSFPVPGAEEGTPLMPTSMVLSPTWCLTIPHLLTAKVTALSCSTLQGSLPLSRWAPLLLLHPGSARFCPSMGHGGPHTPPQLCTLPSRHGARRLPHTSVLLCALERLLPLLPCTCSAEMETQRDQRTGAF